MPFEVFAATDWRDSPAGRVAVVPAGSDYDPAPLVGQTVTLNGVGYFVRDVVAAPLLAGTIELVVEQI